MKLGTLLFFLFFGLFSIQCSQAADEFIEKGHIEELFYDSTVEGYWTETGETTYAYFSPEGRLYYEGSPTPFYFADWFINENGAVCTNDRDKSCMYVSGDGQRVSGWFKRNGKFSPVVVMKFDSGDTRRLSERTRVAANTRRNYENQRALALTALLGMMMLSGSGSGGSSGSTGTGFDPDRQTYDNIGRQQDRGTSD